MTGWVYEYVPKIRRPFGLRKGGFLAKLVLFGFVF